MTPLPATLAQEKGYNVVTAGSVGEAISVLEHGPIDAVVLDVRMPRRSGLELLEFIRWNERLRDLPVLILTGAALTPDEEATIVRDRGYLFYKSENLRCSPSSSISSQAERAAASSCASCPGLSAPKELSSTRVGDDSANRVGLVLILADLSPAAFA